MQWAGRVRDCGDITHPCAPAAWQQRSHRSHHPGDAFLPCSCGWFGFAVGDGAGGCPVGLTGAAGRWQGLLRVTLRGPEGWRGLQVLPRASTARRHQLALLHDRAEMRPAAAPLLSAVPPGPGDTEPGSLSVPPSKGATWPPTGISRVTAPPPPAHQGFRVEGVPGVSPGLPLPVPRRHHG